MRRQRPNSSDSVKRITSSSSIWINQTRHRVGELVPIRITHTTMPTTTTTTMATMATTMTMTIMTMTMRIWISTCASCTAGMLCGFANSDHRFLFEELLRGRANRYANTRRFYSS